MTLGKPRRILLDLDAKEMCSHKNSTQNSKRKHDIERNGNSGTLNLSHDREQDDDE